MSERYDGDNNVDEEEEEEDEEEERRKRGRRGGDRVRRRVPQKHPVVFTVQPITIF